MRVGTVALSVVLLAAEHRPSHDNAPLGGVEAFSPPPLTLPAVSSPPSRLGFLTGGTTSPHSFTTSSTATFCSNDDNTARTNSSNRRHRRTRMSLAAGNSTERQSDAVENATPSPPASTRTSNTAWEADYRTSMATQRRIKAAGGQDDRTNRDRNSNSNRNSSGGRGRGRGRGRGQGRGGRGRGTGRGRGGGRGDQIIRRAPPMQLAVDVLTTLLETPPEQCNAANLVCSLTLSAKLVSKIPTVARANSNNSGRRGEDPLAQQFRTLRNEVFAILGRLVDADLLSPRQLCNSAWAVGKHHAYDDSILPGHGAGIELGMRERWNVGDNHVDDDGNGDGSNGGLETEGARKIQEELARTMDEIAIRLTDVLDRQEEGGSGGGGSCESEDNVVKVGELTMACWAYASTRPREVPPGWELPPRVGRVPDDASGGDSGTSDVASALVSAAAIRGAPGNDISGGADAVRARADNVFDGPMDDVVIFERLDEISTATDSCRKRKRAQSRSDIIVDDLFDAVANVLCKERRPHVNGSDEEAADDEESYSTDQETTTMLQQCPWKDLSTIVWSYANRGHFDSKSTEHLIDAAVQEASKRLDKAPRGASNDGRRTNDSNGDYGVQKNGSRKSGYGNDRTSRFLPRDVSQLAWAVAVLQSDNHRMGDSLVELVEAINRHWIGLGVDKHYDAHRRPFENWQPADLVQLSVALSHGRIDDVSLLSEIYNEALHIILASEDMEDRSGGEVNGKKAGGNVGHARGERKRRRRWQAWELSIMLWVQANLYLTSKDDDVFRIFAEDVPKTILRRIERSSGRGDDFVSPDSVGLGSQEQANIAWSLTVLEDHFSEDAEELLRHIFRSATSSYRSGAFIRLENAHQLWQSYYLTEEDYPNTVADVTPGFREYLERTWNKEKSRQKTSSARHKSLSQTLDLMGVAHFNEHDEDIDVAIILQDESPWTHTAERGDHRESHHKVAVEFDGPNHFTRSVGSNKPRALGHTVLKYRMLKRQGWTVVRVPFFEFDKIPFWASMERQRYLQRLLKTHADIRFSEVDVSEYKPMVPSRKTRFD